MKLQFSQSQSASYDHWPKWEQIRQSQFIYKCVAIVLHYMNFTG